MHEALATYSESQIGMKRELALYTDRIVVRKKRSGEISETPIMLADLRPVIGKLWRHWLFRVGRLVLFASIVPWIMWAVLFPWPDSGSAVVFFLAIALLLNLVGGIMCGMTFRLIEWTRWQNHFGQPWLDVARTGPECDRYDAFVESLELQIMAAQRTRIDARPY